MDLITLPFASSGDQSTPPQTSSSGFVNFTQGYTTDYEISLTSGNPQAKAVERKVQNYLFNQLFMNAQQLQQWGFAPWFSTMPGGYSINAHIIRLNGSGVWTPYRSLVNNNVSDPLTTPANWEYLTFPHEMLANVPMPAGGVGGATAEVITANTDFNTIGNGTYEIQTDAIAAGCANSPVGSAGLLEVKVWNNGSGTYSVQQYISRAGSSYQRAASGSSWSSWSQQANLASPAFTGTPTVPTATAGTNNTQAASTAFVAASFAPKASPAFTGNATFQNALFALNPGVSAAAGTYRGYTYQTNGVLRWATGESQTAEGGSNTGSDFSIDRYSDAGAWLSSPLAINRASGLVTINGGLNVAAGTITFASPLLLNGGSIELGNPLVAAAAYTDFHSSGNNIDYDARIISTGGNGTSGNGALQMIGGTITLNTPTAYRYTTGAIVATVHQAGSYAPTFRANASNTSFEWVNSANTAVNLTLADNGYLTTRGGLTVGGGAIVGAGLTVNSGGANIYGQITAQNGIYLPNYTSISLSGPAYTGYLRADSTGVVGFINNAQNNWNMTIRDDGYVNFPRARPNWAGFWPWDNGNCYGAFGQNGYERLANGWIIQWGLGSAGPSGGSVFNYFPTAFPSICASVVALHVGTDATVNVITDNNYLNNGSGFGARSSYGGGVNVSIQWIAIGY